MNDDLIRLAVGWDGDRWTDADQLAISINDLGVRQGVTAVERLRTYRGKLWQLDRHLDRFETTCDGIGIAIDRQWWSGHVETLLTKNAAIIQSIDVGVVLLATPGKNIDGSNPTNLLGLSPVDGDRVARRRVGGQGVVITDVMQPPPQSWPRQWKVRSRLHYYRADQFARRIDPSSTGMLIDQDGSVTESGIASIAVVLGDEIIVPPRDRILGSVTASVVQEIAEQQNWRWTEQTIAPEMLIGGTEVWLMGTDTGLWFASRVWCDGRWHEKSDAAPDRCRIAQACFDEKTNRTD